MSQRSPSDNHHNRKEGDAFARQLVDMGVRLGHAMTEERSASACSLVLVVGLVC